MLAARSSNTDSRINSSVSGDGSCSTGTGTTAATRRRGFSRLKVFGAMKVPMVRVFCLGTGGGGAGVVDKRENDWVRPREGMLWRNEKFPCWMCWVDI